VLAGRPTLRTLDSERELQLRDVIAAPAGRRGAHRLDNRADEPARVLVVSTMLAPELNEYPDSGKLWARSNAPGANPDDEAAEIMGRPQTMDYLEGETP
jgi:uncharacterized cupin superfamily protein